MSQPQKVVDVQDERHERPPLSERHEQPLKPTRDRSAPGQQSISTWQCHREIHDTADLLQSGQPPVKIEPLRSSMTHPMHRVAQFDIGGPYTLPVAFTDGITQEIDFRPALRGALFGPLRDLAVFNAVTLDQEVGTLTWPNGTDFDPATLHEWPRVWAEPNYERRANTRMEPTRR